jgi:phosphomannomutase
MNRAVVRRTTQALAIYLKRQPGNQGLPVVVAYDGRLTSRCFAEETVGVLVANGIAVRYFDEPTATPIAAYALRRYSAVAAVVVTASHNPADYNGYKLYAPNGAQIVSPTDEIIADLIETLPPAKDIRSVAGAMSGAPDAMGRRLAEPVGEEVVEAYFRDIDAVRPRHGACRDLKIVYTAMHGVGYKPVKRALLTAGFTHLIPVEEQVEPDGHFPTAPFPNPEEPGALDLALATAARNDADLILANDPDADRLAACVRQEANPHGDGVLYKPLTGNQIGLVLADYLLEKYKGAERAMVVESIVSSPMLRAVAAKYGAHCEQTLTGFKWLWNAALDLKEARGLRYVFGFEEALGYSAGDIVRDKDGVSAALLFAELAAEEKAKGSSILQRLARMYREHGLWVSYQHSVTKAGADGIAQIGDAIERIAAAPPKELSNIPVTAVRDFRSGQESRPRWLENSPLLEFDLGEHGRVLARPSGTEPKLKIYVDLRSEVSESANVWQSEQEALVKARELALAMVALTGLS